MIFIPTLCVFLKIKYIKHIEQDFCSDAWVMPQGWNFEAPACQRWGEGGQKFIFFKHGHVAYQIDGDDERTEYK